MLNSTITPQYDVCTQPVGGLRLAVEGGHLVPAYLHLAAGGGRRVKKAEAEAGESITHLISNRKFAKTPLIM